jgi:hypothetical protein
VDQHGQIIDVLVSKRRTRTSPAGSSTALTALNVTPTEVITEGSHRYRDSPRQR